MWPLKRGDCLIQVALKTGLTVKYSIKKEGLDQPALFDQEGKILFFSVDPFAEGYQKPFARVIFSESVYIPSYLE